VANAAVMGGGSWGTGFAQVLADAGHEVTMWARDRDVVESISARRVNERYHPGFVLPESVSATSDPAQALANAEFVVLAVPAQTLRGNLAEWTPQLSADAVFVSLIKGIEVGSTLRMSEVIASVSGVDRARVAVVSGPNLAREIIARDPAGSTIACADESTAIRLVEQTSTPYFRSYFTTDVVGTEIGGAVKNVIALATGMAEGLGFGENAQAALVTRGLAEITRLGLALGASAMTFLGLAGIGDLVATCSSPLSRNRTFGVELGRGASMEELTAASRQTCEGIKSCQSILDLARAHGVDMPITEQVVEVVHNGKEPSDMLATFMARRPRAEQGHSPTAR